jgi:hypothetical protein
MGADIVCVPAFVTPNSTWDAPWGGYSGRSRHFPADVNASHIGNYKVLVSSLLCTHTASDLIAGIAMM